MYIRIVTTAHRRLATEFDSLSFARRSGRLKRLARDYPLLRQVALRLKHPHRVHVAQEASDAALGPYSIVALIGIPRSGTTLIHRMIAAHSQVDSLNEPYQVRRAEDYVETDVATLMKDFDVSVSDQRSLFLKETTTRLENTEMTFDVLKRARTSEIRTGLILVLRSPFEAYLSQVEASHDMWKRSEPIKISDASFSSWARSSLASFEVIARRAGAHRCRVVSYQNFCLDPENELARLMALFPLRLEQAQLKLAVSKPQGGDPKAYQKTQVDASDREAEVAQLMNDLKDSSLVRQMQKIHRLAKTSEFADADVFDELARITILERPQWA